MSKSITDLPIIIIESIKRFAPEREECMDTIINAVLNDSEVSTKGLNKDIVNDRVKVGHDLIGHTIDNIINRLAEKINDEGAFAGSNEQQYISPILEHKARLLHADIELCLKLITIIFEGDYDKAAQ